MEMQMEHIQELPTPEELKKQFPLSSEIKERKAVRDQEIARIMTGESDKFLLLIGPCSADREDAVLDYMTRLAKVQENVKDKILIVPRVYTNKPRTKGLGYKGMLHQPDPHKGEDLLAGIIAIREMHTRVAKETGFSCAEEMLYPENHAYLDDLLSYVAIGARSVEDQQHRMVASGIGIPAGMKNPTSGDLSVMMNAIVAAQNPQTFIYRGWEVQTQGNMLAHVILRGYQDRYGNLQPNYHYEDLIHVYNMYQSLKLNNPAVIVDCNHANSGKNYMEQIRIAKDVLHSRHCNPEIHGLVKGLMIESYLLDGNQPSIGDVYGLSITDACLGWEKSEKLILDIAEELD
ncbi:3-deoxy-7-phosphoheptulonate synthase [Lactimicrobium massiliense]|uniref:3-deoxy-7-phosphoheptulonate synthase n=1 Tax=Lactimicrobium massiliense TaxID=2161814 RepID=UPI000D55C414|nr:3-deoxy-7-phosphoheptulonate synthase [Lactimicrobium massiliense]